MAQDPVVSENANSEIDLDEIEVEILIIAKQPNSVKQTCAFLARRGWPTRAVGNISKAIEEIAEKRPDIVMISLNHPSPAVAKLPELIAQTFNLICIGFVETADTSSSNKLNAAKLRHKIFGAPSGPNFQRGIRRILAEKFNITPDDSGDDKSKGSKTERAGEMIVQKAAQGPSHGKGPTVILGESQGVEHKIVQSGPGFEGPSGPSRIQKGDAKSSSTVVYSKTADHKPSVSVVQEHNGPGSSGTKARKKFKEMAGTERSRDAAGNLLFGENLDPITGEPKPQPPASPDLVGMLKKSLFGDQPEEAPEAAEASESTAPEPIAVLEKAVESALSGVCQRNPDIQPIPLTIATRLGVFPVDSTELPGYLVVALEVPEAADQKSFLKICENSLQGTFNALDVPVKLESGFWIDVPHVSFAAWAELAGAFNFKMNHEGREIGIVYIQTDKPLFKPKAAAQKGMYTIDVAEISTLEPINFKAYLYLKENKKFFLYLRNGRQLQPEQKTRLEKRKIADIYMKSVDLENFRIFLASAFLKGSIKGSSDAA